MARDEVARDGINHRLAARPELTRHRPAHNERLRFCSRWMMPARCRSGRVNSPAPKEPGTRFAAGGRIPRGIGTRRASPAQSPRSVQTDSHLVPRSHPSRKRRTSAVCAFCDRGLLRSTGDSPGAVQKLRSRAERVEGDHDGGGAGRRVAARVEGRDGGCYSSRIEPMGRSIPGTAGCRRRGGVARRDVDGAQ